MNNKRTRRIPPTPKHTHLWFIHLPIPFAVLFEFSLADHMIRVIRARVCFEMMFAIASPSQSHQEPNQNITNNINHQRQSKQSNKSNSPLTCIVAGVTILVSQTVFKLLVNHVTVQHTDAVPLLGSPIQHWCCATPLIKSKTHTPTPPLILKYAYTLKLYDSTNTSCLSVYYQHIYTFCISSLICSLCTYSRFQPSHSLTSVGTKFHIANRLYTSECVRTPWCIKSTLSNHAFRISWTFYFEHIIRRSKYYQSVWSPTVDNDFIMYTRMMPVALFLVDTIMLSCTIPHIHIYIIHIGSAIAWTSPHTTPEKTPTISLSLCKNQYTLYLIALSSHWT